MLNNEIETKSEKSFNSESSEDFNSLTVDELKHRLTALNVPVPLSRQVKSFYINLLKNAIKDKNEHFPLKDLNENNEEESDKKNDSLQKKRNRATNDKKKLFKTIETTVVVESEQIANNSQGKVYTRKISIKRRDNDEKISSADKEPFVIHKEPFNEIKSWKKDEEDPNANISVDVSSFIRRESGTKLQNSEALNKTLNSSRSIVQMSQQTNNKSINRSQTASNVFKVPKMSSSSLRNIQSTYNNNEFFNNQLNIAKEVMKRSNTGDNSSLYIRESINRTKIFTSQTSLKQVQLSQKDIIKITEKINNVSFMQKTKNFFTDENVVRILYYIMIGVSVTAVFHYFLKDRVYDYFTEGVGNVGVGSGVGTAAEATTATSTATATTKTIEQAINSVINSGTSKATSKSAFETFFGCRPIVNEPIHQINQIIPIDEIIPHNIIPTSTSNNIPLITANQFNLREFLLNNQTSLFAILIGLIIFLLIISEIKDMKNRKLAKRIFLEIKDSLSQAAIKHVGLFEEQINNVYSNNFNMSEDDFNKNILPYLKELLSKDDSISKKTDYVDGELKTHYILAEKHF